MAVRGDVELWLRANGAPWLVVRPGRWRRIVSDFSGTVGIIGFALRWFFASLMRSKASLLGVLPLLLVAVVLSFFSTETWQTIGSLHGLPLGLVLGLLVVLGWAFVATRSKPDLGALAEFTDADALAAALPRSLAKRAAEARVAEIHLAVPPLRRAERINLLFVSALAQLIAATVVALAVAVFFVVLGVLAIDLAATTSWVSDSARVLADVTVAGHQYVLTSQLLRVSAFLGTFAGFYLIVSSSTDPRLRESVASGHDDHLRCVLAVRALYLSR
jgi:hypothetical protein